MLPPFHTPWPIATAVVTHCDSTALILWCLFSSVGAPASESPSLGSLSQQPLVSSVPALSADVISVLTSDVNILPADSYIPLVLALVRQNPAG